MKFFIDTADVDAIRELNDLGMVDGVTTNPSLILKSGRDILEVTREICSFVTGPVSAEEAAPTDAADPAATDPATPPTGEATDAKAEEKKDDKAEKDKKDDKEKKDPGAPEFRVVVTSGSAWVSDFFLPNVQGNLALLQDTVAWLSHDEAMAGTTNSEEDVKLVHNKEGQGWIFYGTSFLVPLALLSGGLLRVRSRRKRGAA